MLAYAANRPTIAARRSSPHSMLFIAVAHVVAIAALISARMDLPIRDKAPPLIVDLIHPKPVPKPIDVRAPPRGQPNDFRPTVVDPPVLLPPLEGPTVIPIPGPGPIVPGPIVDPLPPLPQPGLARRGPSLVTPASELKPPYPRQKLILEEEASLTLQLRIDASGRVIAVDPVGRADPVFLAAARRHLLSHWRYEPAIEGGKAVPSTLVTTLHFRLDG